MGKFSLTTYLIMIGVNIFYLVYNELKSNDNLEKESIKLVIRNSVSKSNYVLTITLFK